MPIRYIPAKELTVSLPNATQGVNRSTLAANRLEVLSNLDTNLYPFISPARRSWGRTHS